MRTQGFFRCFQLINNYTTDGAKRSGRRTKTSKADEWGRLCKTKLVERSHLLLELNNLMRRELFRKFRASSASKLKLRPSISSRKRNKITGIVELTFKHYNTFPDCVARRASFAQCFLFRLSAVFIIRLKFYVIPTLVSSRQSDAFMNFIIFVKIKVLIFVQFAIIYLFIILRDLFAKYFIHILKEKIDCCSKLNSKISHSIFN